MTALQFIFRPSMGKTSSSSNRIKNDKVKEDSTSANRIDTKTQRRKRKGIMMPSFSLWNGDATMVFRNLPFIFYLAFLGIVYIANSHYAVKTIKEINKTQAELEQISWISNSKKSRLMYNSMASEMAKQVAPLGLYELRTPPKKIIAKVY